MATPPPPSLRPAAVILAGGEARRMGGGDKPLRRLAGRPMLAHIRERLAGQAEPTALSANGDPARFAGMGLPVLADSMPGRPGPLAGLLAGLDWAAVGGHAWLLCVPGDTPFLPADLVARLAQGGAGPAIAASPDADGRLRSHPTVGLWPVALRHDLRAALEGGMRRAGDWAMAQEARVVAFPASTPDAFFNVNTQADLTAAEAYLAERAGRP